MKHQFWQNFNKKFNLLERIYDNGAIIGWVAFEAMPHILLLFLAIFAYPPSAQDVPGIYRNWFIFNGFSIVRFLPQLLRIIQ
jgi:hypothetical protein